MSFLLDTNTCSAHLRRSSGLMHRFVQHSGHLAIPTAVLAELYGWAYGKSNPTATLAAIAGLLKDVRLLDFDSQCAETHGRVFVDLRRIGITVPVADLMIASVALVHDLTLVTHNTADFRHIPNLRLQDWLMP